MKVVVDEDGRSRIDPRMEMDAQIHHAFKTVIDGINDDDTIRDYSSEQLDGLVFSLSMALVQLAKLPGGVAAKERATTKIVAVMRERKMDNIPEKISFREDAKAVVKKAVGDDVDFTPGTTGHAMMRMVLLELNDKEKLRSQLEALASQL